MEFLIQLWPANLQPGSCLHPRGGGGWGGAGQRLLWGGSSRSTLGHMDKVHCDELPGGGTTLLACLITHCH